MPSTFAFVTICALKYFQHCPTCGECFTFVALCEECYNVCTGYADICWDCGFVCPDCAIKAGTHCPTCGECYNDVDKCETGNHCVDCCDCAAKCAAPTVTLTNDAATGKVVVNWKAVSGAAKYEVYRATSKTGTYSKILTTTSLTCLNKLNATPGTIYYYKVRAIGANGKAGKYSEPQYRCVDCPQPVITVMPNNAAGTITIKWNAVDGATKYEVYRAASADGTYSKIFSSTTALSCTNTLNVVSGTTYYYKVIARGAATNSDSAYSAVVSIKAK